jgi:hypothetical protein
MKKALHILDMVKKVEGLFKVLKIVQSTLTHLIGEIKKEFPEAAPSEHTAE